MGISDRLRRLVGGRGEHEASSYDEEARARYGGSDRLSPEGYDRSIRLILIIPVLFVIGAIGRLIWLQLIEAPNLRAEAAEIRTGPVVAKARRGTIYDRKGRILAVSEECTTIACAPQEVNNPSDVAVILSNNLGGTVASYLDSLTSEEVYVYVARQVDKDVADTIAESMSAQGLAGLRYEEDMRRSYPYGSVGGQIIGMVDIDGKGISGIELYYDEELSGTAGKVYVERGASGIPIAGENEKVLTAPVGGKNIVLSIDIDTQRVAEEEIVKAVKEYKAESGSVMVTDPRSGEVIAACSTPILDITDRGSMEVGSESLKLVTDSYEPGSIFKVLTAAIGIEDGVATQYTSAYVPETILVGADYVHDDDDRSVGMDMTLTEILRRSSNVGMAQFAQDVLGADRFAEGIEGFGIGHATGIDFPGEVNGMVTQREYYDGSSLGSMSFGQGLAIPLVQMVRAIGGIANKGVAMTPHFAVRVGSEDLEWGEGVRVVSMETASDVTDMMRVVVQEGTAKEAQVIGYDIAGKTGTGEQTDLEKGGYKEDSYVSSLIGFAPAGNASVLTYVGLNGTKYLASASAAPTFSTIMGEALSDAGVLREDDAEESEYTDDETWSDNDWQDDGSEYQDDESGDVVTDDTSEGETDWEETASDSEEQNPDEWADDPYADDSAYQSDDEYGY